MMGMAFKAGRMARTKDEIIVNETFADMMHWGNDAVGRTVDVDNAAQMKVAGVLKDFQIGILRKPRCLLSPAIINISRGRYMSV